MSVVVTVFLLGMSLVYLVHLWAAGLGRGGAAGEDRLRLLTLVLETAVALFLARILVSWTLATSWLWAVALGGLGGGAALAAWRARDLPVVTARTPRRRRWRRVLAPLYAAALVVVTGALYGTLV